MKLRRRLSIGFIVTASVPAVLMAALHSYIYLRDTEITIEGNARRFVQSAAREIDQQMQNIARDMAGFVIAGDPAEHTPPDLEHQLAAYSHTYPYFREILWVDPQGVVLASSNSEHYGVALTKIHNNLDDDLALVLNQPAGMLHVSDFDDISPQARAAITSGHAGSEALTLQLLLRTDDALGNAAGVLIATVTNQLFTEVLEDLQNSVPGAKPVALLNRRGELLLSSDPQAPLLQPHALAERLVTELDATEAWLVQFEHNDTDEEISVAQIAGLRSNQLASWRLVVIQPKKYIRYPIYRALSRALVLLAAIVIISGYISLRLARALVRPIEGLAAVAERIRDGDFTAHATVGRDDEIGRLAQAFNAMATALEHEREALRQSNQSLERSNRVLEERQHRSHLLTEMTALLQSARHIEEAAQILPQFLKPLFAPSSGALYLIKSSQNYLDLLVSWGELPFTATFEILECWGLRRGQPYLASQVDNTLVCPHIHTTAENHATLCVPIMADGTTLGLLHLVVTSPTADALTTQVWRKHAQHVTEHLGLTLANLKLRTQLRDQSIRDIQTGLHNRRYLEESLPRELARAEREQYPVAVFMLDVDHFKKFNDVYGHEAGDAVLHTLGHALTELVRTGDLVCRFGGEEFTVALPRATLDQACDWAERLMQRVRRMEVMSSGKVLPAVTVSIGLAFYPEHGTDHETVIQAADLALYEAKRNGRDRLIVYGTPTPSKTSA